MIGISRRRQRTLAGSARLAGRGMVGGREVHMTLLPAPEDHGIVFRRTDLPSRPMIPATVASVSGTQRRTTLGTGVSTIALVEHVISALAGMRIDNAIVELDAPEPPGSDGSAAEFVAAIRRAGVAVQKATKSIQSVESTVIVRSGDATLRLDPASDESLRISYILDYGLGSNIAPQMHTANIHPDEYEAQIAPCRTFLLESEVDHLRRQGVGLHLTAADLLVYGRNGVIGNSPRFADEPARHKILDIIGDLALCGMSMAGEITAYRSGHALNVELARELERLFRREANRTLMSRAA